MRRTRMNKEPAEPIKQMTFSGEFKDACPYCGYLITSLRGGELRCAVCGQRIITQEKGE